MTTDSASGGIPRASIWNRRYTVREGLVSLGILVAVAGAWHLWGPEPSPARPHNYDLQEGSAYGYTAALSNSDREGGRVGQQIVMVLYAGQREGRHQVHIRQGALLSALECGAPCDVVKMITVMDIAGVPAQPNVQMLRNAPGMLAGLALEDAIKGRLAQYRDEQGRAVWVDSVTGVVRQP